MTRVCSPPTTRQSSLTARRSPLPPSSRVLKRSCLSRSTIVPACTRYSGACAPHKRGGRARLTGAKTESISIAAKSSSNPARSFSGRCCASNRAGWTGESRAYPPPRPQRCHIPSPAPRSPVFRATPGNVRISSIVRGTTPANCSTIALLAPITDFVLFRKNPVGRISCSNSHGVAYAKSFGSLYFLYSSAVT